ncbi:MAG: hypothetical protein KME09_00195 [Pleurocapsa minor HA4230-MV1]|jgi:hypothetical protein|nr:hypothetical protein [Pleurocapsa minor HA4230-MV1]
MFQAYFFSQLNYGNEAARQVLTKSFRLTQNTARSWDRLWEISVDPGQPLWQALTELGGLIAALSLIYLAVKESNNKSLGLERVIDMLKFPLAIGILLSGNGFILANLIKVLRAFSQYWLSRILEMTFAGISISDAIQKVQNTLVANSRAREIFSECINKSGSELQACLQDPIKIEQAQQLSQSLSGSTSPLQDNILEQIARGVVTQLDSTINIPFVNLFQYILSTLQWCFVNAIEASLLLTALYAPVALGLSTLPIQGPNIIKWLSGYISLLLMSLGYVIVVGFTANVLALTEQAGQPLGSASVDTAFLVFISLIAPILAIAISKGIGDGLFEGISRATKAGINAGGVVVTGGGAAVAKTIAAKIAANKATKIS